MRAFVHDDEIPLQAEPRAGQVAAEVAIEEVVAVGDAALMLHAEVGGLDQLVAIGIPGVRPEPMLEAAQHRDHLLELAAGRVGVVVERPEVE